MGEALITRRGGNIKDFSMIGHRLSYQSGVATSNVENPSLNTADSYSKLETGESLGTTNYVENLRTDKFGVNGALICVKVGLSASNSPAYAYCLYVPAGETREIEVSSGVIGRVTISYGTHNLVETWYARVELENNSGITVAFHGNPAFMFWDAYEL